MASQLDLDQGGTSRAWSPRWLGPSLGWVWGAQSNVLAITAGGTYALDPSTSLVTVNTAGSVTITLYAATLPSYTGAGNAQPGLFTNHPVTIVDIGGNAQASPITINPVSGSENIMGLSSISLNVNYGAFVLQPSSTQRGWDTIS